ncbi:serine/threonine-protein phosphatase 7 long form homolog [Castanea sativa]|uniref:serine/threonine-protein phosphatase 7 long form homolog n=1 Tax=Castanea sativa TaxID=21020 RepID=UPI003F64CCD3
MDLDHALITALVERWRPETHSFHLPHGEMTITLQDIEVILGVPVHGLPVVGFTHMDNWRDFCIDLLGFLPPDRPVGTKKNTAVLEGPRIKAKWLEEQFRNLLPVDATEVRVQQYARYYILQMLGSILFMDKSGERLSIIEDSQVNWWCTAISAVVGVGEVSANMSCDEASTAGTAPRSTYC